MFKQSWGERKIVFAHVKNKMKYEPYVNYSQIFWLDSFKLDSPNENAVSDKSSLGRKLEPRGVLLCFWLVCWGVCGLKLSCFGPEVDWLWDCAGLGGRPLTWLSGSCVPRLWTCLCPPLPLSPVLFHRRFSPQGCWRQKRTNIAMAMTIEKIRLTQKQWRTFLKKANDLLKIIIITFISII